MTVSTAPSIPADQRPAENELAEFRSAFLKIQERIQETVVGQDQIVRGVLMAMFLHGHVLLEGVPGLGKTLLVNTLGQVLGIRSMRVQFTPDLMPVDIIGTRVIKQDANGSMHFEFERGPVFTQLLLADEINRATPKTQSAMLEAMQERHVTVAGTTYQLPEPFVVLATQNPLEQEGTYPLPEAQLDRFLFKLLVRFPTELELIEIVKRTTGNAPSAIQPIVDAPDRLLRWAKLVRSVPVATPILDYAAKLLLATHAGGEHPASKLSPAQHIRCRASPRGMQALILAAKLHAILGGRSVVTRQDINHVAKQCLRHRIILSFDAEAEGIRPDQVIDSIIEQMS